MKTIVRSIRIAPAFAMTLAAGLLSGCGASAPEANLPAAKPATAEDITKANASVEAGREGFRAPGVSNAPKAK